jgi:apolipoprotein D and lipocalin family protein
MAKSAMRLLPRGVGLGLLMSIAAWLTACSQAPLPTVPQVDLERFMGPWYVLGSIPTFIERGAHNAVETYELDADGTIATTFSFRRGGFDGERVEYRPRGFVCDASNAVWGMQFVWPVKAEYRIVHLSADYTQTVIGRSKRDYVWIMARTPAISQDDYDRLVSLVGNLGYDTAELEPVPQRW